MRGRNDWPAPWRGRERGSVLLLVLFICLAVAVVIQALFAVVLCARKGGDRRISGAGANGREG